MCFAVYYESIPKCTYNECDNDNDNDNDNDKINANCYWCMDYKNYE